MSGDALAQLIQTQARAIGLEHRATGAGLADLKRLLVRTHNLEVHSTEYSRAFQDILEAMKKHAWPDEVQGMISACLLTARANYDLQFKHAET